MNDLADIFTSRGNKFFHHPAALEGLRNGKPRPVVTHHPASRSCQFFADSVSGFSSILRW